MRVSVFTLKVWRVYNLCTLLYKIFCKQLHVYSLQFTVYSLQFTSLQFVNTCKHDISYHIGYQFSSIGYQIINFSGARETFPVYNVYNVYKCLQEKFVNCLQMFTAQKCKHATRRVNTFWDRFQYGQPQSTNSDVKYLWHVM